MDDGPDDNTRFLTFASAWGMEPVDPRYEELRRNWRELMAINTPLPTVTHPPLAQELNETLVRQEPLKLKIPNSVTVIGCGGVGSWIALFLALAGVKQLLLWDMDTVADHNLNRLPLPSSSVGHLKSDVLAAEIKRLRPDVQAHTFKGWTPELGTASLTLIEYPEDPYDVRDWVVAATDSLKSRKAIHKWTVENFGGSAYVEAAAEGEFGSVTQEPADWQTSEEDNPGYASVPVWVGPCTLAASVCCAYILHNGRLGDDTIRMGWDTSRKIFSFYQKSVSDSI